MKTLAFFNNKGGVGKTSLIYHLAWMFADQGIPTLAVDLDPQANLTAMFLEEARLVEMWEDSTDLTIYDCLRPLLSRTGDVADPHVEVIENRLGLVAGNLALSKFEDLLSENWPKCLEGSEAAFRVITSFYRIIYRAATTFGAKMVLIDVGPNLGAINRSALIGAERVILPLAPDLFSMQGLKNLGPTLREWRAGWKKRLGEAPKDADIELPGGLMQPSGYVVMQHSIRDSRPVKAYQRWLERMPQVYRQSVLDLQNQNTKPIPSVEKDPFRLALLKHYRSLMPLAMDARKPMFYLKPSDGAIGAHVEAVKNCYSDFLQLTRVIDKGIGLTQSQVPHEKKSSTKATPPRKASDKTSKNRK